MTSTGGERERMMGECDSGKMNEASAAHWLCANTVLRKLTCVAGTFRCCLVVDLMTYTVSTCQPCGHREGERERGREEGSE